MPCLLRLLLVSLLSCGVAFAQDTEKAEKYHRLLLKKPENPTVFDRFVEAWRDAGSKDDLQKWLEVKAKSGDSADWRILASFHDYLGEGGEAVAALDEAIKKEEKNLSLRLARAEMMGKTQDFEPALEDLKLVVDDEKLGERAMKLQGRYLARVGLSEEAVSVWTKLIDRFPNDEELREDLIEIEVIEGLYEEAIAGLLDLIKLTKDPYQKALYRLRLAEVQLIADQMDEGLKTYKAILASTGEGTWLEREVLSQVERVFTLEDNVQGLRAFYQELRETYPQRVSVRKGLVRHMARYGELTEAIELFREILKSTPGDIGNREEFISLLEANLKWRQAREELRELIRLRKDDSLLWERLVNLEHQLKDNEGLKAALARLQELKSGTQDGVIAVAETYERVGFSEHAEKILREGREVFPQSAELVEALASLLVAQKKIEEAKELWLSMSGSGNRDDILRVTRSMASHQMQREAFDLLLQFAGDAGDDPLVLTQLGKLAMDEDQAIKAIPFMNGLVLLASSPTDLENAIVLASQVVARSGNPAKVITNLSAKPGLSVGERCFLAELQLRDGDLIQARKTLARAGVGMLAKFYRVRFEENQGDLFAAIDLLKVIVKSPEGRKTVHLRRLVTLYQRAGRIRDALSQAEEWKEMAPGDQQAWLTRAKLLQEAGLLDEAVAEHRRIIGRFGPNTERRARLAEVLQKSGDLQSAEKIYQKLYEEAEILSAKLNWVEPWTKLARDAGREGQLIERFSTLRDRNRREVGPVLALAEVYRTLGQSDEQREALMEVARRRPEDSRVLVRMAEEAGREGNFEFAIATLRDAVALGQGEEAKRALAKFLIQDHELEEGLAVLQSIPGEGDDPRKVEKAITSLAQVNEWEAAQTYLKRALKQHPGDWRLGYLYGILLKKTGEIEEALAVFQSLDRKVAPLTGLFSQTVAPESDPAFSSATGKSPEVEWMDGFAARLSLGQGDFIVAQQKYRSSRRTSINQSRSLPITFNLPDSPEMQRLMSFVQLVNLMSAGEGEEERAAFDHFIEESNSDRKLFLLSRFRPEDYRDFLLKKLPEKPGDLRLSLLWLSRSPNKVEAREVTRRAIAVLRKSAPLEAMRHVLPSMGSGVFEPEEAETIFREVFESLPAEDKGKGVDIAIPVIVSHKPGTPGVFPSSDFAKYFHARLLELPEAPTDAGSLNTLFKKALIEGRGDEAITLVNRSLEWWFDTPNVTRRVFPLYRRRQNTFGPPVYPLWNGEAWLFMKSNLPSPSPTVMETDATRQRSLSLLDQLQEIDGESKQKGRAEVLRPHAHKIKHPLYRGVMFKLIGVTKPLKELVAGLVDSNDKNELRFVAAYHAKEKNYLEAYRALLKMRRLELERGERELLDGNLAYIGNLLGPDDVKAVDLGPAREAILRVQRRTSKGSLAGVMRKLGLDEEAARIEKIEKSKKGRKKIPKRKITRALTGVNLIKHELTEGRPERAVGEMRRILKLNRGDPGQNRELRKIIRQFTKSEHIDLLLKSLQPRENRKDDRWYVHAIVARELGRKETALEGFEIYLKLKPEHRAAMVGRHICQDPKDRDWSIFSPEKNPGFAHTLVPLLISYYQTTEPRSFPLMLEIAEMSRNFLQESGSDEESLFALQRIGNFVTTTVREFLFEDYRIQPLTGVALKNGDDLDVEKSKKRIAIYGGLFEEMLVHQSLAEQSFKILKSNSKLLELTEDDLFQFANRALVHLPLETPPAETLNKGAAPSGAWAQNSNSLSSERKREAFHYLLSLGRSKDREVFTPAALAFLEKSEPVRYESYRTARKICEASPQEGRKLYQVWMQGLPKEEQARNVAIGELSRFLVSFGAGEGEWINDHQEFLVTSMRHSFLANSWRTEWGYWIFRERGREAFYSLIDRVCEVILGDREKWSVISKLPYHHCPKAYRDKNQNLSRALQVFTSDSRLIEPVASAIRNIQLERLQPAPLSRLRSIWAKRIKAESEIQMEWFRGSGGLIRSSKKGERDPARLLVFCEAIRMLQHPNQSDLATLGGKLDEDDELDPMMKDLLRVRLGLDVDVQVMLTEHLDGFEAMAELAPKDVAILFLDWFPGFETLGAHSENDALVKRLGEEMRKSAYAQIVEEAGVCGGASAYLKTKGAWSSLGRAAGYSPGEAARAFEQLLLEILELSPGSKMSGLKAVTKHVQTMLELLGKSSKMVSVERRVKFVHRLYDGLLKDHLQMPEYRNRGLSNSIRADLDLIVKARMSDDPFWGSISRCTKALFPILEKLNPAERQTFLMLIPPAYFDGWKGGRGAKELGEYRWLHEEVRVKYPVVVDYLCAVFSSSFGTTGSGELGKNEALVQGADSLLRFMENNGMPSALRMKLGYQMILFRNSRRLLSTRRHWDWIAGTIESYEASGVRYQSEVVPNLAGYLVLKELRSLGFVPKRFLDVLTEATVRKREGQQQAWSYQKKGATKIVPIALGLHDLGNARKLIEAYPAYFQRDLGLLWKLFEAGEEGLVRRIFDPEASIYYDSQDLNFEMDTPGKSSRFLTLFPQDARFYLEFLIAGRPDVAEGNILGEPGSARIVDLAARFENEGPEAGPGRLHLLSAFATEPEAAILVRKELRLVEKKHRLGSLHRSGNETNEAGYLRGIIRAVIKQEISEGMFVSAKRQYQSICGSTGLNNDLVEDAVGIVQPISLRILELSTKDVARAKEFRNLADFFFEETLRLEVKDSLKLAALAESFAFLQHLLAEDEVGWDILLDGLGMKAKERYTSVIAKKFLAQRVQKIKGPSWRGAEHQGMRIALQKSLWSSERFQTEVRERPGFSATYLTAYGLALSEEITSLLNELPKDLDRAHFFLWRKAVAAGANEETLKWFEEARKVAREKDERELESEIMIDEVVCLMDLNRKEEALKLGKKVKFDLLERLDRKKIITDLLEEKE